MSNATETRPALTADSAIAHGLAAETVKSTCSVGARLHITAKRPGEILRFLAACGLDCTVDHETETTKSWAVRGQDGGYIGGVLTAASVPDYALFTMGT